MQERAIAMMVRWGGLSRFVPSPDPDDYNVIKTEVVGPHLIAEVGYPSCAKCSYEGNKLMVFANTNLQDAVRWKRVDPHFADPTKRGPREAPPPIARFPASAEGWAMARQFARVIAQAQAPT